ncbi:hypothetical protein E1171_04440, partial [Cytophagales bacterium RKSG123]|nr:hypothetical protein [Xanthovirga aplysinae]
MQVHKAGSMLVETTIPDNDWHHYAIVFANTGTIYVDAQIGEEFNNPAPTNLSAAPAGNVYLFELNYVTGSEYWLDELRVWDWNLEEAKANLPWYNNAYVAGDEDKLLFNYRFDMQDDKKVFNMTASNRGDSYTGETDGTLNWVVSEGQQISLAYKSLTNENGDYTIHAIDHKQNTGNTFDVVPFKAIPGYPDLFHRFDPATHAINLTYQADDNGKYQKVHDMIDISQMPISGMFYYHEPSESNPRIPAPEGITMMIDGVPQTEAQFLSDLNGNYLLYAALGDKEFKVSNPEIRFYSTGAQSLHFDGNESYAAVANIPNANEGIGTWTGWIKKSDASNTDQTILNIGDGLALVLNSNQNLVVQDLTGNSQLIKIEGALNTTDWVFFALTYDGSQVTLKAGNSEQVVENAATSIPGTKLLLGIQAEANAETTAFTGYLDQLEYRNEAYGIDEIADIEAGRIINKDEQYLQLSYSFAGQDSTYRAISRGPNAHERVMTLHGAKKTQFTSHNYQKDYQTNYLPTNVDESLGANVEDESYSTTVLSPKTNLDFEITNRYGLTGHIQTPCGYGAGAWEGTVERTDLPKGYTFKKDIIATNFNNDNTVFHIDGLVPGSYKVKLINQENGRELENFNTIKIDSANYVYDFEWKNPLEGAMKVYAASSSGAYDSLLAPLSCTNGIYELESGVSYELELQSFEMYGNDQCMIDNIEYTASGDLGANASYTGEITSEGTTRMRFTAGTPNYSDPTTPRKFTVTLTRTGGIVEQYSANLNAFVTGSEMSSPNFTIVNPDIMTVLHDPPGDNSTITLNEGTSISHKTSHSLTGGADANFGVAFGNEFNNSVLIGGFVGGVINQLLKSRIEVTISANVKHTEGGEWVTEHNSTITSSVTTNGAQDIVGEDADVFIGRGQIMTIGTGRKVEVNAQCVPELKLNREIVKFDYTTPFYYTATGIKGVLQNQLDIIKNDPNSSSEEIAEAETEYNKWMSILTENSERIRNIDSAPTFTDAFFSGYEDVSDPNDFSISGSDQFSFGGKVTVGLDVNTSKSDQNTYNNSTTIGTGYESKSDIAAFGFLAQLKTSVKLSVEHKFSDAYTDGKVKGYSIKLLDDEIYDHFSVTWKKDPKYGTPMFRTFAGQSKCPFESGTENR